MSKPNEWWTLRRAARHVVVGLWTSDELWSRPESILNAYEAVRLLRDTANLIPDKPPSKKHFWLHLGG